MIVNFSRLLIVSRMYYAVAKGASPGIYRNWDDCKANVLGFKGAVYKKFNTEAEAKQFIAGGVSGRPSILSSGADRKARTPYQRITSNFASASSSSSSSGAKLKDRIAVKATRQICSERLESTRREHPNCVRYGGYIFQEDADGRVHCYTDGSCLNNGQYGAKAGLGVYFGEDHPLNISAPVSGRATNNCGEIEASSRAIRSAKNVGIKKIAINTDSQFLIKSVTSWMSGWKKRGWKLASGQPVKNKDEFVELDELLQDRSIDVEFIYVEAHRGILGNERADELAKRGGMMYKRK